MGWAGGRASGRRYPGSASLQREKRCKGSGSCPTNRRAARRVKHGAGTWLHSAKQDSGVFNEVSFGRISTVRTLTYDEAVSSAQRLSTTACPELGCGKGLPSADPQYVRVGRQRHPPNSPSRTSSISQSDRAGLSRRGRSRGSNLDDHRKRRRFFQRDRGPRHERPINTAFLPRSDTLIPRDAPGWTIVQKRTTS